MGDDFVAIVDADTRHKIQAWRCSCLVHRITIDGVELEAAAA